MFQRGKSKSVRHIGDAATNAYELLADEQLWQKSKAGDRQAFSQIFLRYYKPLHTYGVSLYPDKELIRDCIQEIFLEMWLYRESVAEVDSVKFYVFRSFRRRVFKRLETIRKNPFLELNEISEQTSVHSFETLLIKEQSEEGQKNYLLKELSSLPKRQQEAIYLKFYQDLSYEKIAEMMSLNYQSVKNLVHNGVKSIREKLLQKDIFTILWLTGTLIWLFF
ncbi:sigma-70 family RNA polymerase sigma factor [Cytophagaceae bacterium DM2B3-1]|uniref:Sigma-70 family RNA polymerase sigma factor n=1 Tax=Xanthocytophaga flava TaxID=3048013 RepID=A0ABT7CNR8_9BACT|nr:sigma-70 family RNA polymerase sigma factor [Xanthocytophaga flavus]MDJ1472979.1 sigma-70 family RNA polymerase sigma factor [Xanthocytophaga flavus]MDJ1495327.1 sigma-70 family RNA polymerase sigma factor [Xanthocytophaga flavus]